LPPGLTLTQNGITGLPSESGTFTFTITATNGSGTASATVSITIAAPVPVITSVTPQNGTIGTEVTISGFNLSSVNAVSFGGTPAQSFRVVNGSIIAVMGAGGGAVQISTPLGAAFGGTTTFELPNPPRFAPNFVIPNIPSGDENATFWLAGENIRSFAGITVTPISPLSGAATGPSLPLQILTTSETGATVSLPVGARLPGTKRLTIRVADFSISSTFAVVAAPMPTIASLSVHSTTASGEAFTTIVRGSGFFRNGFGFVSINEQGNASSSILDANTARVHIPAPLNVRAGNLRIRIENFDGQSTEATVQIIGRTAPLIVSITPRWTGGSLQFVVRGLAFSPRITAILGRRQVTVLAGGTDTEFVVAIPSDYIVPTFGTALLMVENPDGQRYGFLIGAPLFAPPSEGTLAENKETSTAQDSQAAAEHTNGTPEFTGTQRLAVFPNPAQDMVIMSIPSSFTGKRVTVRLVDVLGNVVLQTETTTDAETMTLPVQALAAGAYRVEMRFGARAAYGAVVKQP
jgi:hypothetical protein